MGYDIQIVNFKFYLSYNWSDLGHKYKTGPGWWHGRPHYKVRKNIFDAICKMVREGVILRSKDLNNKNWFWGVDVDEETRKSIYLSLLLEFFQTTQEVHRENLWSSDGFCNDSEITNVICSDLEKICLKKLERVNDGLPYQILEKIYFYAHNKLSEDQKLWYEKETYILPITITQD